MREYTISIYNIWLPLLKKAIKNEHDGKARIKEVIVEALEKDFAKSRVVIEAESDDVFFMIGFFVERLRNQQQQEHYNLDDIGPIRIEAPVAFYLICKRFDVEPHEVLKLFAGDCCQHPFITGGSDERMMAKDYFLRHYYADRGEEIFDVLESLRGEWKGNSHMEEFKLRYIEEMNHIKQQLHKESNQ